MSDIGEIAPAHRLPFWRSFVYFVMSIVAATFWFGLCYAAPSFPALTGRVVDQTAMLDAPATAAVTAKLAALEQKTGVQLVVAILRDLQGYEIRDYGYQLGRHWQLGQKDKNNGILLLIVPSQNNVAIEVGYGLEPVLTDATSRVIIENAIIPNFRAGNFAAGVEAAIDDITKVVSGEALEVRPQAVQDDRSFSEEDILPLIFILFVVFIIMMSSRGKPGGRRGARWGTGGFGSSSGGFGGSSGGFSGGGGSFGGGGASGRW